jgi:hypothetical protein
MDDIHIISKPIGCYNGVRFMCVFAGEYGMEVCFLHLIIFPYSFIFWSPDDSLKVHRCLRDYKNYKVNEKKLRIQISFTEFKRRSC